jgi:hypothetical protein
MLTCFKLRSWLEVRMILLSYTPPFPQPISWLHSQSRCPDAGLAAGTSCPREVPSFPGGTADAGLVIGNHEQAELERHRPLTSFCPSKRELNNTQLHHGKTKGWKQKKRDGLLRYQVNTRMAESFFLIRSGRVDIDCQKASELHCIRDAGHDRTLQLQESAPVPPIMR